MPGRRSPRRVKFNLGPAGLELGSIAVGLGLDIALAGVNGIG